MRSGSLLSFLLLSVSFPVLAAAATDTSPSSMTDWHVAPMMASGSNTPSYCAMATHYAQGPVVTFTRNAVGKGSIALDFANAELQKGKRYSVSLSTSGVTQRFTANAIGKTQLVLQTGLNHALNSALAAGDALTVTLDGTDGTYTLAGNTRAFFEFDHCLKALGPTNATTAIASAQQPNLTVETKQAAKIESVPVIETPLTSEPAAMALEIPVAPVPSSDMNIAETEPAAGIEMAQDDTAQDARSRLKSSLAQARAEAGEENAPDDMPAVKTAQPAPVAKPERARPEIKPAMAEMTPPQNITPVKPIIAEPVFKETKAEPVKTETVKTEPEKVVAKIEPVKDEFEEIADAEPVPEKPVAAPDIRQASSAPLPLAAAHDSNAIHGLLFDNTPTTPKTSNSSDTFPASPAAGFVAPAPIVKTEPVKQEVLKPTMPPVVKKDRPPVTPHFEANEAPIPMQDVLPSLPPAMPSPIAPTLSVERETPAKVSILEDTPQKTVFATPVSKPVVTAKNIPSQLNTMTPSVGHPAAQPFTDKTQIRKNIAERNTVSFTPVPSSPVNSWTSRKVEASAKNGDDAFCMMENSFDNDMKLMIGQRADGYSTLGLNYGIDMLSVGKNYRVTVKVDNDFDEDFTGYAESSHTLIVQMGKKRSFFDMLSGANAMNVAMQGVASTFALQNLSQELDKFSSCVVGLGGNALNSNPQTTLHESDAAIVPVEPVKTSMLAQPKDNAARPVPIADEPIAKKDPVLEKMDVIDKTYQPTKATSLPVSETAHLDKMPEIKSDAAVKTASVSDTEWKQEIRNFLTQSGVRDVSVNETGATWSDGDVKGTATPAQGDIIDAADGALTQAEKSCTGEFTSQMGVPETYGAITAQPMESKCMDKDGTAHVSTWLVRQEKDGDVTAVQLETPRDDRSRAFQLRDKMLSVLKKSNETSSSKNETDQDKTS